MSIGIGAFANKVLEDAENVIYEYGSYNLNIENFMNSNRIADGSIFIQKTCFVEPDIHEKIKKMPSGRKKYISKRITVSVDYEKYIREGSVIVENCNNCWQATNDEKKIDVMALHLLFDIFLKYQEQGNIPESISYNV